MIGILEFFIYINVKGRLKRLFQISTVGLKKSMFFCFVHLKPVFYVNHSSFFPFFLRLLRFQLKDSIIKLVLLKFDMLILH